MGIKFRCPNGHKLNVKSFLAGKRGVCPDCGVTFRIPDEPGGSDIQAAPLASLKGGNGAAIDEPATRDAVAEPVATAYVSTGPVATGPATTVAVVMAAAPVAAVPVGSAAPAPIATGIPLPVSPAVAPATIAAPGMAPLAMPGAAPAAPAAGDPIAEAPAAIWYVRPPSGGQYGPARGDVMRKWIGEGRVSGDSLVWREGWTDWRNAGQLFPSLGTAGGTSAQPGPAIALPQTARTATRYAARKKGGAGLAIAALVGLVLVCLVLVVVLVIVLTQQSA